MFVNVYYGLLLMGIFFKDIICRGSENNYIIKTEKNMIKKLTLLVLIAFCVSILTGCNTFRGLGKDIESLGRTIKKAGNESEEK